MSDRWREILMRFVAGGKSAYWIHDRAAAELVALESIPGEIGAIMLARCMKQTGATSATFTLSDFKIEVTAIKPQEQTNE